MMPWRPPVAEPLVVISIARSHVGLVRPINEDRVFDCPERRLWAVADGMGGHSSGDLAAQAVVDALRELADSGQAIDGTAMLDALHQANSAIVRHNDVHSTDAGSTVVAAHLGDRLATIAWAGDSRAYLIRRGVTTQLSHDHSLVQELVDAGLLTMAAAASHPRANVVTRALGVAESVEIASMTIELDAGDRVLLCSDGLSRSLHDSLPEPTIGLDVVAETLMANALRRDGTDNISLVCVDVD